MSGSWKNKGGIQLEEYQLGILVILEMIKNAIRAIIYSFNVNRFIENILCANTMLGTGIRQRRKGRYSYSQKAFSLATWCSSVMTKKETRV